MKSHLLRMPASVSIPLLYLALLVTAICGGCAVAPPVGMSLLTGEPCEPPCWQGLTPGESTQEQVAEFIRVSGLVDPQSLYPGRLSRDGQRVGVSMQWRSRAVGGRGTNSFTIEDGILKGIIIYPDYDITLDSLLERYGPPEKVAVGITGVHIPSVGVTMFYPTQGFTAYLELAIHDAWLRPESTLHMVWYFRAAPLERFLELRCESGYGGCPPEKSLESLRDWPGYGMIELP